MKRILPPEPMLFDRLIEFVCEPPFRRLLDETTALPVRLQHEFVELVWLDKLQLEKRGVIVPTGLHIERSWFEDKRPTLCCVVAYLPDGFGWKKITVTIDARTGELSRPIWDGKSQLGETISQICDSSERVT